MIRSKGPNHLIVVTVVVGLSKSLSFLFELIAQSHEALSLLHVTLDPTLFRLLHKLVYFLR